VKQLVLLDEDHSIPPALENASEGNPPRGSTIKAAFEELLRRHYRTYLIIDGISQFKSDVRNFLEDYPLDLIRRGFSLSLLTTSHNYLKVHKEINCDNLGCTEENLSIFFHFSCSCNGDDFDICHECKFNNFSCSKDEHDSNETYETVYMEAFPREGDIENFCLEKLKQFSIKPRQSDDRQHGQQYHDSAFVRYLRRNQASIAPIAKRIAQHAQKNFQIANIWLENFVRKRTVPDKLDDLIHELDQVPQTRLSHYFMEKVENMKHYKSPDDFSLALETISMIISAFRPINVLALQHALALDSHDIILEEDLTDREVISMATSGLLRIEKADDANSFVYLTHDSIRAIKVNTNPYTSFQNLHEKMARLCLKYLEHKDYSQHSMDLVKYPFLSYVLDHWADHVREVSEEACFEREIKYSAIKFLKKPEKAREIGRQASKRYSEYPGPSSWLSNVDNGLHLCAWYNLSELVKEFHPNYDVFDRQGKKRPLNYACANGSEETVKTLLESLEWSPQTNPDRIQDAIQDAIVGRVLFDQERSVEQEIRRLRIVKMILERCNRTLDSQLFRKGRTILMYSVICDYYVFARELLRSEEINMSIRDEDGRTALWHTVGVDPGPPNDPHIHSCEELVKIQLDKGASIDGSIRDNAISNGNLTLLSILDASSSRLKRKRA
jgi:hypothetical protein